MQVAFTSHELASVVQRSNPAVFEFENKFTCMAQVSYMLKVYVQLLQTTARPKAEDQS